MGRFWTVSVSGYDVSISSSNGRLWSIYNRARMWDQYKRKGRTGKVRYKTKDQWLAHLRVFANRMGVPKTAKPGKLEWAGEGEVKDANPSGYVACKFLDSAGKPIAIVNCDPQDGELMMFTWER